MEDAGWQNPPNRLKGFPAHDDRMMQRGALKVGEVFRQMPRQISIRSDEPVAIIRNDQSQLFHTDTSALIAG